MPNRSCGLDAERRKGQTFMEQVVATDKIGAARESGVLRLTFNRPDKKNALDRDMYRALVAALEDAQNDSGIRAVLFAGAGNNFTAGNDLVDFLDFLKAPGDFPALAFIRALAGFKKPLVAAVRGDAIGVGATMLFHCDLVYVSPDARLQMPFIDLALVPEAGASLLVPRRVGMAKASQFLMLGESFDGAEAVRLGVANGLFSAAEVEALAMRAAQTLAAKPPQALMETRRLLRGDPAEILARIDREAALFAQALASEECRTRIAAFFTRR